jgi:hypothetical protein
VPNRQHYYEPDAIDCNTAVQSLAQDFGVVAELSTRYEYDQVVVICTTRKIAEAPSGVVQVQSLVRAPLKSKRNLYVMQYSALLDCWHQLDRGVLGVAQTPIERQWNGRPKVPTATRK